MAFNGGGGVVPNDVLIHPKKTLRINCMFRGEWGEWHSFFLTAAIPVFFKRISSFWSHKKEKKLSFLLYFLQTHATLQEKVI
jgi:hypothetical protein